MRERIPARGHPKLADGIDRWTNSQKTNTHSAEPLEDPAVDSLSLKPQAINCFSIEDHHHRCSLPVLLFRPNRGCCFSLPP